MSNSISKACTAFNNDMLVAMPTETVYGLAAPVNNIKLIEKVFALKKRPSFDPLIVHVSHVDQAKKYTIDWSERAQKLAEVFWPGALTMILKKSDLIDPLITSGLDTVGLRCPDHAMALSFINKVGVGLAAPSANTFTRTSPTSADHVIKYFSEKDVYILDGGECTVGIESTIVDLCSEQVKVLRPGMISLEQIESVLNEKTILGDEHLKSVPGAEKVHYKPQYSLILALHGEIPDSIKDKSEVVVVNDSATTFARKVYGEVHKNIDDNLEYKVIDLRKAMNAYPNDYWDGIINRLKKASIRVL